MPHETPLIATIAIGLGLAFIFGLLAQRLRLPTIVGYLVAGIIIGPFTPGFVADQKLAAELAEIGVILLMFGVGLHFSLKDLLSVRAIAIPGAIGQIAIASLLGAGLARALGWTYGAAFIFGLSLSVASTVVLLRALQKRGKIETENGRIAVGWLIVEDLIMVITLVLIPPLTGLLGGKPPAIPGSSGLVATLGLDSVGATLFLTGVKVSLFVALMLIVGRKVIPWILHYVAHTGSRELFRLAVLAIALGVAYGSANLFGVSFALGAFFAGMVLAESQLSSQAAKETLPLRDAFAVLFFVSVGMLFNPAILASQPLAVIATVLIITAGKSLAAYAVVRSFGHAHGMALSISASLAQIGEFSFILIVLAVDLAIVPPEARDLVVAGSIVSILINPLLFMAIERMAAASPPITTDPISKPEAAPAPPTPHASQTQSPSQTESQSVSQSLPPSGHIILVGHGRMGSALSTALLDRTMPIIVVEEDETALASLRNKNIEALVGAGGEPDMLASLNLKEALYLVTTIPDAFEAGHMIEEAKTANPDIYVIARAQSAECADYLRKLGADLVLMGEEETAQDLTAEAEQV
ncbi:MAG: Kef family K(+) transporter [Methylocystaceae bacterium]|nr:Kef family K(+) transporter [Methylocystaceae bacterium]